MQETKNKKKNPQPVNKEAFKMLATEIGLNAAARKLEIPIPTAKSWAQRGKWKLPKRTGGRPGRSLATSQLDARDANEMPIANALAQTHEELEQRGKGAVARAAVKSAEAFEKLPIPHPQALSQLANALGRVFQWSNGGSTVNVHAEKAVIVCDEGRRAELIAQRQRLLEAEAEKRVPGRTVEFVTAASQETQPEGNVGAGNDTVAQDQKPAVTHENPFYQHMQAIGKGESLRTGKGSGQFTDSPVVTDFMPWPEENQGW